jgi:hypothetical protein
LLLPDCTASFHRITGLVLMRIISSDKDHRPSRRYRSAFGDACVVWGRGSSVELSSEGAISDIFISRPIGGLDRSTTTYTHNSTTQTPTALRRLELSNPQTYHTHAHTVSHHVQESRRSRTRSGRQSPRNRRQAEHRIANPHSRTRSLRDRATPVPRER